MDLIMYGMTTTGSLFGAGIANGTKKDMTLTENGLHDATEVQEHMATQVQTGTVLMGKGEKMMADREKVIDELNTDVLPFLQHHCDMQCSREKRWISKMIITVHDAIALLKEQEAKEQCLKTKCIICPHCDNCDVDENGLLKEQEPASPTWEQGKAYCGKCGQRLPRKRADREINYCGYCGRQVKWDG